MFNEVYSYQTFRQEKKEINYHKFILEKHK